MFLPPFPPLQIFLRERLNGYYGVSTFTVANTLASLPFIFLIAVVSSVTLYWIVGLNPAGGAVIYFILDLFLSLVVVESIMMAIAPIVPNFLMGIAAGAGLLGFYMIVCGFFQPVSGAQGSCQRRGGEGGLEGGGRAARASRPPTNSTMI